MFSNLYHSCCIYSVCSFLVKIYIFFNSNDIILSKWWISDIASSLLLLGTSSRWCFWTLCWRQSDRTRAEIPKYWLGIYVACSAELCWHSHQSCPAVLLSESWPVIQCHKWRYYCHAYLYKGSFDGSFTSHSARNQEEHGRHLRKRHK